MKSRIRVIQERYDPGIQKKNTGIWSHNTEWYRAANMQLHSLVIIQAIIIFKFHVIPN
jgi:hypothetical protein